MKKKYETYVLGKKINFEVRNLSEDYSLSDKSGYFDSTSRTVVIRNVEDIPASINNCADLKDCMYATLCHEIVHAFIFAACAAGASWAGEDCVDFFGQALPDLWHIFSEVSSELFGVDKGGRSPDGWNISRLKALPSVDEVDCAEIADEVMKKINECCHSEKKTAEAGPCSVVRQAKKSSRVVKTADVSEAEKKEIVNRIRMAEAPRKQVVIEADFLNTTTKKIRKMIGEAIGVPTEAAEEWFLRDRAKTMLAETKMSERQRDVLNLFANGMQVPEIVAKLNIDQSYINLIIRDKTTKEWIKHVKSRN